jgi:hypothetical protein
MTASNPASQRLKPQESSWPNVTAEAVTHKPRPIATQPLKLGRGKIV